MEVKFRRAVVTGGAGFLGRRVCQRLLEQGTDVVCVDNLMEVAEPFAVTDAVDLVLHLASPASPADYARYPLETLQAGRAGTRNALELAARSGARFVLASASDVYGAPLLRPQPGGYRGDVGPAGPRGGYDEAKRYAEALTAAYRRAGLADTAIARIFHTYGSGMRADDGRMVPVFAGQALRGEPLTVTGDGTQTRSLCHADDTARGLLLLAASDLGGPLNIGNPGEATVGEIAARIISLAGSASHIRYVPRPSDDPVTRKPDITFARLALGFEPLVSWREGLAETVGWFRRVVTGPPARPREPVGTVLASTVLASTGPASTGPLRRS